MSGSMGDCAM